MFEKTKTNEKDAGDGPFFKKRNIKLKSGPIADALSQFEVTMGQYDNLIDLYKVLKGE